MKKAKRATIVDAAQALAGVCDGAVTRDGQGFNGADSPFVQSLLGQAYLTQRQLNALHHVLRKYRKQLSGLGFNYEDLEVPTAGPRPEAKQAVLPSVAPTIEAQDKNPVPTWPMSAELFASHFPGNMTPRQRQLDALAAINDAFRARKKVVVLEMPTGGGKSVLCMTAARAVRSLGGFVHFLTIQKALQDQYTKDFPAPEVEVLKGRANYTCELDPTRDCGNAKCTDQKKGLLPECVVNGDEPENRHKAVNLQLTPDEHLCPYWRNLQKCHDNAITLFNFSSFLYQARLGRFGHRELMIIDEAHNIEQQLMSFVSIELTEWTLRILDIQIDREIQTKDEFMAFIRESGIREKIQDAVGMPDADESESIEAELDKVETEAIRDLGLKIENFMRYVDQGEWVFETVKYNDRNGDVAKKIVARPLYAKQFASDLLFGYADRVLVMSATILDSKLWAENLGISPDDVQHIKTPCDFPASNRPVHLEYAGNMGAKHYSPEANPTNPTKPKFLDAVKRILDRHAGQRGLIHCHSFQLMQDIYQGVDSDRLLMQVHFDDKDAMLRAHDSKPDAVIVAPAMHEGLDFKDDRARFQIIAKIPWPSLGDRVIKERAARSDRYYAWLTALKLVQSYGRIVRSKEDWGYTYILDSGFEGFCYRNGNLLPVWFREAIRKGAPTKIRTQ